MEPIILFVEDNPDLRDAAALILRQEGFLVETAIDGRHALQLLDAMNPLPDVIVSDVLMPNMDGYELLENVRQRPEFKAVPFIFLTALAAQKDIKRGRMTGVDEYMVKPFDPQELISVINRKLDQIVAIRKRAEDNLEQVRKEMLDILSNELRTPLTHVVSGVEMVTSLLQSGADNISIEELLATMALVQQGMRRLQRIAEQMGDLAELRSGQAQQNINQYGEELDVPWLVSSALSKIDDEAIDKGVTVHLNTMISANMDVFGRHDLLISAFSEVIRNALHFSSPGSAVVVDVRRKEKNVMVRVTDYGAGLDETAQMLVWQPLQQREVGMGLAIAKECMQAHQGTIDLVSAPGRGTEVTMSLPAIS